MNPAPIIRQIQSLLRQGSLRRDFSICSIAGGDASVLRHVKEACPEARCVELVGDDIPRLLASDPPVPFDLMLMPDAGGGSDSVDRRDHEEDLPRLAETWLVKNARYTFVTATRWQMWRLVQAEFTVARLGRAGHHRTLVCFSKCDLPRSWPQRGLSYALYVWACLRETYRQGGPALLAGTLLDAAWRRLVARYYRLMPAPSFTFRGQQYRYFNHPYNATWSNERSVEVPITRALVQRYTGKRILEVGNVLWHYGPISHDVLDKYERAPGVINADVVDFRPDRKYDLIVSISTLEHVGWDEGEPPIPERGIAAFENLKATCLAPGGTLMVTVPFGWNPDMDRYLRTGRIRFDEAGYLTRDKSGRWREVDAVEAWRSIDERPTPDQQLSPAIVVGVVHSP